MRLSRFGISALKTGTLDLTLSYRETTMLKSTTIDGLAKLHQWGTLSGSLSAEDNEIIFAWATELLDVLPARTEQSREQLLAAPLLRYLDQQQTEAVGGE